MAKKKRRRKVTLDQRVIAAFARNGLNTTMLDMNKGMDSLRGDVRNLTEAFGLHREDYIRNDSMARLSRKELYTGLNEVKQNVAGLTATVASLTRIVPLVDAHEAVHQQGIGKSDQIKQVGHVITKTRAVLAAVITGAGGLLAWLLGSGPKPG